MSEGGTAVAPLCETRRNTTARYVLLRVHRARINETEQSPPPSRRRCGHNTFGQMSIKTPTDVLDEDTAIIPVAHTVGQQQQNVLLHDVQRQYV